MPAPQFSFSPSAPFTLMQVTDIQERGPLHPTSARVLHDALAEFRPDLLVFTGDNNEHYLNERGKFEVVANSVLDLLRETKTPFAVTFGNHDSEIAGPNFYSRRELYNRWGELGGELFVDHDEPSLTGAGSGVIRLCDAKTNEPRVNVYLVDSGDYCTTHGNRPFDNCNRDKIRFFEETHHGLPSLWFQHIAVREVLTSGLLVPATAEECPYHTDRPECRLKAAPCVVGSFKEFTSTTSEEVHRDADHTLGGRTLYESWVQSGVIHGAFFGHSHMDAFAGRDHNGIVLGYTKALTLRAYNDGNCGLRVFRIRPDGSYATRSITDRPTETTWAEF